MDIANYQWLIEKHIPEAAPNGDQVYVAQIQAGGENGNTAINYPITIEWNANDVPATDDATKNPSGSTWYIRDAVSDGAIFNVNMANPVIRYISNARFTYDNSTGAAKITLDDPTLNSFIIYRDVLSGVEDTQIMTTNKIVSVSPNPINGQSEIKFNLTKASNVRFELIDQIGKVIGVVGEGQYGYGEHTINWDSKTGFGSQLSSGAYSIRMVANGTTDFTKVMIVR